MERELSNPEQTLQPDESAAKAAILAEYERLTEARITFVAVHFDGSGDEGVNEDIKATPLRTTSTKKAKSRLPTSRSCRNTLRLLSPTDMRTDVEASAM